MENSLKLFPVDTKLLPATHNLGRSLPKVTPSCVLLSVERSNFVSHKVTNLRGLSMYDKVISSCVLLSVEGSNFVS
jgi:hypothetical protein